jgi:hypothetical protein
MSPIVKELATMNFVVIGLIVIFGVAFLRVVKRRMED